MNKRTSWQYLFLFIAVFLFSKTYLAIVQLINFKVSEIPGHSMAYTFGYFFGMGAQLYCLVAFQSTFFTSLKKETQIRLYKLDAEFIVNKIILFI